MNYARADIKGGMLNLLKTLTCAADFIKIDCQSSLPIYASPEKLRCEPETAIDRPGAPGRCPRAGISLPVSKRMPSGTTNSRVLRPVRAAPEPRAGTHAADGRGIQPRPSRRMAGEFSRGHRGADPGTAPPVLERFPPPPTGLD